MNPLVAEIERLQEWDGLWGATRNGVTKYEPILAALKLAVEGLEKITGDVTSDGKSYGSTHCDVGACQRLAAATLRAIAEKLGVKG